MISIRTTIGLGKKPHDFLCSELKTLAVVETAIPSAATATPGIL
jgi:hypothetical protein